MEEAPLIQSTGSDPNVLSVADLNRQIRGSIESQFSLVWVKGELSNFKAHTSGHFYFSLKDSSSQIKAVMFRGHNQRLRFKPQDGLEVVVRGKVTVYEPRGDYQISVDLMEPVGAGALQRAFEDLKLKLKNEGLFETSRKRPLPTLPRHIAIVTSPTGAAIRDILNVLTRRFRGVNVTVVPSIVQGAAAAPNLRESFVKATQLTGVDVIIIGRGGGSIEDMWCFNDEALARLIATSPVPVISAVGHEIDFTIADFVADLRAPTPSAAAELVVKNAADLLHKVENLQRLLKLSLDRTLKTYAQKLISLSKRLVDPKRKLQDLAQRNDDLVARLSFAALKYIEKRKTSIHLLEEKLGSPQSLIEQIRSRIVLAETKISNSWQNRFQQRQARLQRSMAMMDSLSPLKVVDRGYGLITAEGKLVKSTKALSLGQKVNLRLAEGSAEAEITKIFNQ